MKTILNKFFLVILFLFGVLEAFSAPSPPMPTGKRPPPPPGLPIDEDIYIVFVLGLIYGIYFIYNYNIKQKTPI